MTSKSRIALLAVAGLLALPVFASAFHWPNFGGDAGHSGFQPVDQATLPISTLWAEGDPGTPRTSIVTTGGAAPSDRALAYGKTQVVANPPIAIPGTGNDRADVHIRQLDTGDERTTEADRDVDDGTDDPEAFGTPTVSFAGVSFVSASNSDTPGQLYVVHNDTDSDADSDCALGNGSDNDIAIARFDVATGDKEEDFAVGPQTGCSGGDQITDGYRVESSPVITPPLDASGRRFIFFVARPVVSGSARLFRVEVDNADSSDADVDFTGATSIPVAGANPIASPTLVHLTDNTSLNGNVRLYVAVTGVAMPGDIRTYAVDDLSEQGPSAAAAGGTPQTASVPVTASGDLPGQSGSGATKAPALYVPYDTASGTVVRRFVQAGAVLEPTSSGTIEGDPAPALAVTAIAAGDSELPGRVIVTTSADLVVLDSSDLDEVAELADDPATLPDGAAFARNTAAASGELIFVTNDVGDQAVLSQGDAEPLAADFPEHPGNAGADSALGQPAYSDGFLQFLTDAGVFVYRTAQITKPPVANLAITPNPVRQGQQVTLDGSGSSDPDGSIARYELDLDGNGQFETDLGEDPKVTTTASAPPGTYPVGLRVTDDDGATATTTKNLVVAGNQAPTASFKLTPSPAKTRERVTFDASASKDPDGTIAKYEWDLDGNGTFETTSTKPTTTRRYSRAALYNPKLRVTDNDGATGEATQQLVVTQAGRIRARRLTAKVRPTTDTTSPRRFTTRGRLVLPKGVSRRRACRGRVTIVVKAGKDTISRRTTKLRRTCRYRNSVTFDERDKFDGVEKLKFKARFQGNRTMLPRQAKTKRVRISA